MAALCNVVPLPGDMCLVSLASFKWLLLCKQIAAHSQLTLTTSTLIPE